MNEVKMWMVSGSRREFSVSRWRFKRLRNTACSVLDSYSVLCQQLELNLNRKLLWNVRFYGHTGTDYNVLKPTHWCLESITEKKITWSELQRFLDYVGVYFTVFFRAARVNYKSAKSLCTGIVYRTKSEFTLSPGEYIQTIGKYQMSNKLYIYPVLFSSRG